MIYDVWDDMDRLVGSVEAPSAAAARDLVNAQIRAGTRTPTHKERARVNKMRFDSDPRVYHVDYVEHPNSSFILVHRIVADHKMSRAQLKAKMIEHGARPGPGLKIVGVIHTLLDSMGRPVGKPRRGL